MQLRASFFGTAGELAFSGFVYQMGGTLHRAQIRFVPKDAPIDATMPIPGARRSPRHVVEGNDLDEVIAKSRELIEREIGAISEFKQVAGKT
jgi:hypothetical protein